MAAVTRYEGWYRYRDTGTAYRSWRFLDAYEPFKAFKSYKLQDRGPVSRNPLK